MADNGGRSLSGFPKRRVHGASGAVKRPAALACAAALAAWLAGAVPVAAQVPAPGRDGAHDFDFNIGVWRSQIKRVINPLSGGDKIVELHGTVSVRKVWDGRAELEEIEADGPSGHWEGLTVFLYNPQARQWSQSFANSTGGRFNAPLIGSFKDGRGELYASDTFDGRSILVRGSWSDISTDAHRYEEAYSDDGGRSWHPAFMSQLTRMSR
jgi:hypothetical protein